MACSLLKPTILRVFLWAALFQSIFNFGRTKPTFTMAGAITLTKSANDAQRLLKDFVDSVDHRIRPKQNQSEPIEVTFTFNLLDLIQIDEVLQKITLNAWMSIKWTDELRQWNSSAYSNIDVLNPDPLNVWRPRIAVANSMSSRDIFADDYAPLTILSSGETTWSPGAIWDLSCAYDLTEFPFDSQTCEIRIITNENANSIRFLPRSPKVNIGGYTQNGEWELIKSSITPEILTFDPRNPYMRVIITFTFDRRPWYYVMNTLVPIMALSLISLTSFLLPKDIGERASFSITVLLSLAVFMGVVASLFPSSSDTFPVISIYIFILLCLSALITIVVNIQLRIFSLFSSEASSSSSSISLESDEFSASSSCNYCNPCKCKNRNTVCNDYLHKENEDVIEGWREKCLQTIQLQTGQDEIQRDGSRIWQHENKQSGLSKKKVDFFYTGSGMNSFNIDNNNRRHSENDAKLNGWSVRAGTSENQSPICSSEKQSERLTPDKGYGSKIETEQSRVTISNKICSTEMCHRVSSDNQHKHSCQGCRLFTGFDDVILFILFSIAWILSTLWFFRRLRFI